MVHISLVDNEPIGFATYFFGYNGDCGRILYLEDIYIKPEHRSKGYGTTVFKYVAKVSTCVYISCTMTSTCILEHAGIFYITHTPKKKK